MNIENIKPLLAGAFMALALLPSSKAGYIREQNGQLTTDLPGVLITPSGIPGVEAWDVGVDPIVWAETPFPRFVAEPEGEAGLANRLISLQSVAEVGTITPLFRWESDVAIVLVNSLTTSGVTETWFDGDGDPESVTFEDLSDAVPDSSSTAGLLLISCAPLAFAARTRFASSLR